MRAISINVFMIFIYLNIFISQQPIGGGGPCSANDMQMGCNIECFVLSQVYSGVFCVEVSNTTDLQARADDFLFMMLQWISGILEQTDQVQSHRPEFLINTKVQAYVELSDHMFFIYGLMGGILYGVIM